MVDPNCLSEGICINDLFENPLLALGLSGKMMIKRNRSRKYFFIMLLLTSNLISANMIVLPCSIALTYKVGLISEEMR